MGTACSMCILVNKSWKGRQTHRHPYEYIGTAALTDVSRGYCQGQHAPVAAAILLCSSICTYKRAGVLYGNCSAVACAHWKIFTHYTFIHCPAVSLTYLEDVHNACAELEKCAPGRSSQCVLEYEISAVVLAHVGNLHITLTEYWKLQAATVACLHLRPDRRLMTMTSLVTLEVTMSVNCHK